MRVTETVLDQKKQVIYFDAQIDLLETLFEKEKIFIITDENVFAFHEKKLAGYKIIIIPVGEQHKNQQTADSIINRLLEMDADKTVLIVGVGGGMVTDIAGYVSSVYKRGVQLALVPTTILSMTDAAIGGKNGVNAGQYKNMVGTTKQPEFLIYDYSFLQTLPEEEWISGFAEIIKHACIKDSAMFEALENTSLEIYRSDKEMLATLVEKNVALKINVVANDVHETGERYLLNFGHTFGHAIENIYRLPHGFAVSLGMVIAAKFSKAINNLPVAQVNRIIVLLQKYHLPVALAINKEAVTALLKKDKKRSGNHINFVLLEAIGSANTVQLTFSDIDELQTNLT